MGGFFSRDGSVLQLAALYFSRCNVISASCCKVTPSPDSGAALPFGGGARAAEDASWTQPCAVAMATAWSGATPSDVAAWATLTAE